MGLPMSHGPADKTSGLHKLLHCARRQERPRWGHGGINRFLPAVFFAAIIGVIIFVALSAVLLEPRE
jgi:hypothetical protein